MQIIIEALQFSGIFWLERLRKRTYFKGFTDNCMYPPGTNLFKVNNENPRAIWKSAESAQQRRQNDVNEVVNDVLVSLL